MLLSGEWVFYRKEEGDFKSNLQLFGKTINHILEREDIPLFRGSDLTIAQKKSMIFILLFAGQETTASLLSYILWKLASNPVLQELLNRKIVEDRTEIDRLFDQSLKEFNASYGIPRLIKVDTCLEYTLRGETVPRKHIFFKGESISVRIDKLAQAADEWFPFGRGPHLCPGQKLAETEIKEFVLEYLKKYVASTTQKTIETAGQVTLTFAKPVFVLTTERL